MFGISGLVDIALVLFVSCVRLDGVDWVSFIDLIGFVWLVLQDWFVSASVAV